jgi:hypothetical protein
MSTPLFLARRALVLALALTCLAPALAASAASTSASSGTTSATFTYGGSFPIATHPLLTIRRTGQVIYRHAVTSSLCANQCWPSIAAGETTLQVVSLNASGPDVVLSLYSGGAHCCFIDQVFAPSGSTYVKSQYDFGDPGARVTKLAGTSTPVFLSADDAFAYAFTDYAASGLPVKVLAFSDNHFVDVTRSYPTLIANDAKRWWSAFESERSTHYADSTGLFAAWAADEYLLGHVANANAVALAQARAGRLHSGLSPIEPSGVAFVHQLERFLIRHGYRSSPGA